jgi:hypothetical protein
MKCKAKQDGLIGTTYHREGDVFEAKVCPHWATPVARVKKAAQNEGTEQKDGE